MATPLTFGNPLKFGPGSCHNDKGRPTFLHREREHSKPRANHATHYTLHTRTSRITPRETGLPMGPPTRAEASPLQVVEWRPMMAVFSLWSRLGMTITTNPPSCIVLIATTAAHVELKPQIIHLLPSFHELDKEDPYMHRIFLRFMLLVSSRISLMTLFTCIYSLFPWRIRQKHGLILCHLDQSLHGNYWSQNSSLNFSQWPRPMLWGEKL